MAEPIDWDALPDAPAARAAPVIDWDALPDAPQASRGMGDVLSDAAAGFAMGGVPGAVANAVAPNPTKDELHAATLGVSQGGTYGFVDELGGLIGEVALDPSGVRLGPGAAPSSTDTPEQRAAKQALNAGVASTPTDYELFRNRMRSEVARAEATSPLATGAGKVGGAIGASILTRKAPGMAGMGSAAQGALEGGVNALGESTSDTVTGMAADTAMGGLVGGVLGKAGDLAGQGLAKGASAAKEWLGDVAAERALKAAGAIQKDFPTDKNDPLYGQARKRFLEKGSLLLDEPGVVGAGSSAAGIGDRAAQAGRDYGRDVIGRYLKEADEAGVPFDTEAFAQRVEREVLARVKRNPALDSQAAEIERLLAGFRERAARYADDGTPYSFQEANEIKGDLQKAVFNEKGDVLRNEELAAKVQGIFTEEIDTQLEHLLGPDDLLRFQDAKKRYGAMVTGAKLGTMGANRSTGNNVFGLPDYFASTIAAASGGGPVAAAATGAAASAVRGRADSVAAVGAKALSEADWLRNLANTNPEALGEFAGPLTAAIGRGADGDDTALNVAINVLSKTSQKFREMMAEQNEVRR